MSNNLTIKQENFAQEYVKTGNASEAYRRAYDVKEGTKAESVHRKAKELLDNVKIGSRIQELRGKVAESHKVDREWIIEKYMSIIGTVEDLKKLLAKDKLSPKEKEKLYAAARIIGASDATTALANLAKMLGLNEPEKQEITQKTIEVRIIKNQDNGE